MRNRHDAIIQSEENSEKTENRGGIMLRELLAPIALMAKTNNRDYREIVIGTSMYTSC